MVESWRISGLLAVSRLALACETEAGELNCSFEGCGMLHQMSAKVASDAPISELTIEACFNDECGSVQPESEEKSSSLQFSWGDVWVSGRIWTDGERKLSVGWHTRGFTPKIGDRYAVRVKAADGTTVAESVQIAESYLREYPNGEKCAPTCLYVDSTREVP